MDIYTRVGTKIIVTKDSIKKGYDTVKEHAKEHLEVDKTYTLKLAIVNNWDTAITLEEFPNQVFNSVSFENIQDESI